MTALRSSIVFFLKLAIIYRIVELSLFRVDPSRSELILTRTNLKLILFVDLPRFKDKFPREPLYKKTIRKARAVFWLGAYNTRFVFCWKFKGFLAEKAFRYNFWKHAWSILIPSPDGYIFKNNSIQKNIGHITTIRGSSSISWLSSGLVQKPPPSDDHKIFEWIFTAKLYV